MLNREWVQKTEEFVRRNFDAGVYLAAHPDARNYRIEHTYRVANIGLRIARAEGFDETEMVLACLLHDVSYGEDFGENGWKDHGRRAAKIARPFLTELGVPEARVNDICYGIAIHVDDRADFPGERTAFALSVGDADNLDRFDVYRIHETLCSDSFLAMSLAEKRAYAEKRLAGLRALQTMPMGTAAAREMWRARLSFCLEFYEKLADQLACSESVTA